jgi:hypothetical protein
MTILQAQNPVRGAELDNKRSLPTATGGDSESTDARLQHLLGFLFFLIFVTVLLRKTLLTGGVVVFEDMVPFFTRHQLLNYLFDSWFYAMQNYPLRGRYIGIWATLLRYSGMTRISLVVVLALSGFTTYLATFRLLNWIVPSRCKWWCSVCALVSATYVLLMLIVAKASHYYSLILGSAILYLQLVNFMRFALLAGQKNAAGWTSPWLVGVFLCFVPSIQILALAYLSLGLVCIVGVLAQRNLRPLKGFGVIVLVHLVPYVIYLLTVTEFSVSSLAADVVPFDSEYVLGSSVSPLEFASTALFSASNRYNFGSYAPIISLTALVQTPIFLITLLNKDYRQSVAFRITCVIYIISYFFSLGIRNETGGYHLWIQLAQLELPGVSALADASLRILRAPHRWTFLQIFANGVFISLFLIFAASKVEKRTGRYWRPVTWTTRALLVSGVFVVFFFPPYIHVFSGDLGGALRPVELPDVVQEMRVDIAEDSSDGKLMSYPILGMAMIQWDELTRSLLGDEFYCLLFEVPCIEGASGTTSVNRFAAVAGYHLLSIDSPRAPHFFSMLGVRYIFLHNDLVDGLQVPSEQAEVLGALHSHEGFELVRADDQYSLFRVEESGFSEGYREFLLATYAPFDQMMALMDSDAVVTQSAVVDLMNGDLSWSTFLSIATEHPGQVYIYRPYPFQDIDILLSMLFADGAGSWTIPAERLSLTGGYPEGWGDISRALISSPNYFTLISTNHIFGEYSALGRLPLVTRGTCSPLATQFNTRQEEMYDIFIRAQCFTGCDLDTLVDHRLSTTTRTSLAASAGYQFAQIYQGRLGAGEHALTIIPSTHTPVAIDIVYAVPSQLVEDESLRYRSLVEQGSIRYLSNIGQAFQESTELAPFYFYNRDLYSANLRFATEAPQVELVPIRSGFGASVGPVDRSLAAAGTPLIPIHIPQRQVTFIISIVYLIYCLGLAISGVTVLVVRERANGRVVFPAKKRTRE